MIGRNGNERGFFELSVPSSQLHAPPQIPEHADRIDRIGGTRNARSRRRTTADVLKAERPGKGQLYLFVVSSPLPPPFCAGAMSPG
jgi:hypothetical protein